MSTPLETVDHVARLMKLLQDMPKDGVVPVAKVYELVQTVTAIMGNANRQNEEMAAQYCQLMKSCTALQKEVERLQRENDELILLAQQPAVGTFHA